ncbi:pyruvate kinase [Rhodovulum sp. 12E13]|uniref:pyruvate kinase n=1 Tax=Rhodovulum sp. 12E13 TaxID=2203891 RepID=UPI000E1B188F|nr:pyruvate kinase [Rhodovulum sp. 12E13]RDC72109.1 pyruvate kinase [Rhodovulum sp. 12E13]
MRRNRNVKIVATLGPASSDHGTIRALFDAGADVFRLNMSHGSHDEIAARHRIIREVEQETGRPIAILADLQGPKLRVGVFAGDSEELMDGQRFRLDLEEREGDASRVELPHPEIFAALSPGATLLVNDGKIRLRVDECGPDFADCTVMAGGTISNRKGVNVPDVVLPVAALSDKDKADLEFVCELGVDWLGLSFVQRADDMHEARTRAKGRAKILAKIEKPAAVQAYDEILVASDGIMVARGDLGVELPVQNVPPIQKQLIRGARSAAKPVIVATQMLESMIESPVPTRAEVSDVATAIYEGADAVMLSAESAAGQYPVEAVTTMNDIAMEIESHPTHREIIEANRRIDRTTRADAIVSAAREIAENTGIEAICCFTESGTSAALIARERPRVPIVAITPHIATARRLCLYWGVNNFLLEDEVTRFKMAVVGAARTARAAGFATENDHIVVVAGVPFNEAGTTNILRIAPCDERLIFRSDPE